MLQPLVSKPQQGTPTPNMDTLPSQTPMEGDMPIDGATGESPEAGQDIVQNLEMHLDQLQDQDKAFLAEHLTPEFVRAIGLINGPEVANYLNQFVDPDKVLVPVPREIAEQFMAQQGQQAGAAPQPQGQPMPQPQAQPAGPMPAPMPQGGGMMAPKV